MDGAVRRDVTRGSVSIEVAVLAPAFIALLVLAGVAGRTAVAAEAVDVAAHDAARAASISRNAGRARDAAQEAAEKQANWRGLNCEGGAHLEFSGSVDGQPTTFDRAFGSDTGQEVTVTVLVTCQVSYRDLRLPVLPGMLTTNEVSASFTSPLDRYRSRR
ncbi:TadE/TadG family type IV pilus assembly protein [Micromonospora sp. NPDC049366]|uniref:TadE/TadG family type IV pilus assembly protein n=1 Tax=Micromonospora sp. NPDC049366 TaxID=3364271 RepID=UPI0037A6AEE5